MPNEGNFTLRFVWQFDAAIRVPKEPMERDVIAAKLVRGGIASESTAAKHATKLPKSIPPRSFFVWGVLVLQTKGERAAPHKESGLSKHLCCGHLLGFHSQMSCLHIVRWEVFACLLALAACSFPSLFLYIYIYICICLCCRVHSVASFSRP